MTLNALIVVLGLAALLFFTSAIRSLRLHRLTGACLQLLCSAVFVAGAVGIVLVVANMHSYERLRGEQPAGDLRLTRVGYHQFFGVFTFPSGERTDFALRGDEWQVDAQVLRWNGLADLLGVDTAYRLDRISGRYTSVEDEQTLPRTVYALNPPEHVDLWSLVHRYHAWLPFIDALYGSATFLPMADGAEYEITVSRSGLVARPVNKAAAGAVGSWQ